MRLFWIPLTVGLACSGQTVENEPVDNQSAPTPAATADGTTEEEAPEALSSEDIEATRSYDGLENLITPSPQEMHTALNNASNNSEGLTMPMPEYHDYSGSEDNRDHLAVQTGVLLADLVLTWQTATIEQQTSYLQSLKRNCLQLDVGEDVPRQIDSIIEMVQNERPREEMRRHFDILHGVMVPELETEGAAWLVPLVQAGSWLEGAHLLSQAFMSATDISAANDILLQPRVVEYFQHYVAQAAADGATVSAGVVRTLQDTLATLKTISEKSALSNSDINTIHSETGEVLDLLRSSGS